MLRVHTFLLTTALSAFPGLAHAASPSACTYSKADTSSLQRAAIAVARCDYIRSIAKEENLSWQDSGLVQFARLMSLHGEAPRALREIHGIPEPRVRLRALSEIASDFIRRGEYGEAERLVRKIAAVDEWTAGPALLEIARTYQAVNKPGEALRAARLITRPEDRHAFFKELTEKRLSTASDWETSASEARESALALAGWHAPCGAVRGDLRHCQSYESRLRALAELGELFIQARDLARLDGILEDMRGIGFPDETPYVAALLLKLSKVNGSGETAGRVMDELKTWPCRTIGESIRKTEILSELSGLFDDIGDSTRSDEALRMANEEVSSLLEIDKVSIRVTYGTRGYISLARAELSRKNVGQFRSLVARATELIRNTTITELSEWNADSKSQAFMTVVALLLDSGESSKATLLIEEALAEVQAISDEKLRTGVYRTIAQSLSPVAFHSATRSLSDASLREASFISALRALELGDLNLADALSSNISGPDFRFPYLLARLRYFRTKGLLDEGNRSLEEMLKLLASKPHGWDEKLVATALIEENHLTSNENLRRYLDQILGVS